MDVETRGPGMRLRYIGLGVPNVDEVVAFFLDDWELEDAGASTDAALLRAPGSEDEFILRVRAASSSQVDMFGFGVDNASEVDELHRCLRAADATIVGEPASILHEGGGYGFRFFDPDGHLLEVASDSPRQQTRTGDFAPGQPLLLSHFVINATQTDRLVDWYCAHLGFRVTDRLEDKLIFLTTTDAHHQIAIATSTENGLNHIAYECHDVDSFMRAAGRLQRRGHHLLWGPGRHGPGDNTFAYFRDPAGFVQEFTTGLESVGSPDWKVRSWRSLPEESDLWGTSNPRPNDEFVGRRDPGLGVVPDWIRSS